MGSAQHARPGRRGRAGHRRTSTTSYGPGPKPVASATSKLDVGRDPPTSTARERATVIARSSRSNPVNADRGQACAITRVAAPWPHPMSATRAPSASFSHQAVDRRKPVLDKVVDVGGAEESLDAVGHGVREVRVVDRTVGAEGRSSGPGWRTGRPLLPPRRPRKRVTRRRTRPSRARSGARSRPDAAWCRR